MGVPKVVLRTTTGRAIETGTSVAWEAVRFVRAGRAAGMVVRGMVCSYRRWRNSSARVLVSWLAVMLPS